MAQNSNNNGCLWVLLILLLCPWLIIFIPVLFGLFMGIFGIGMGILGTGLGLFAIIPAILSSVLSGGWISVMIISLLVAILLPIIFIIYTMIKLFRGNGLPRLQTWIIVILIWLLSLVGMAYPLGVAINNAGGIEALKEQLANQDQVWEYSWSNEDEDEDENENEDEMVCDRNIDNNENE